MATPQAVQGGATWLTIATLDKASCGLRGDGSAWCWGLNSHGQLANGGESTEGTPTPTAIVGNERWSTLSGGPATVCAIRQDGSLWCWGSNSFAQLAMAADDAPHPLPVEVALPPLL